VSPVSLSTRYSLKTVSFCGLTVSVPTKLINDGSSTVLKCYPINSISTVSDNKFS